MRTLLSLAMLLVLATGCTEIVDADPGRLQDPSVTPGDDGGPPPFDANEGFCPGGCDDGIACTLDRCNADDQCEHTPSDAACGGPGNVCVGIAICDPTRSVIASGCVFSAPEVNCDDGIACTVDVCDPTDRSCRHVPQADRCDDGIACTVDSCAPLAPGDGCVHAPDNAVCSSGFCNRGGFCDATRGCVGGTATSCDDRTRCTIDTCDEVEAVCNSVPVDADGDGFAAARVGPELCPGRDCDDNDADVNPDAREVCGNLIDDDCDGFIDRGCQGCGAMPEVCPEGWSYSNDGSVHECTVSFTPPSGVRPHCTEVGSGVIGYSFPLTDFGYVCPASARFAPQGLTGYCLWEDVTVPPGGTADCGAVNAGELSIRWPCR